MIKNHRESRKSTEPFAAHARSEVHALQIDRDGADQTDAVETKFDAAPGAKLLQHLHVVQYAGGGFAGGSPEALGVAIAVERLPHLPPAGIAAPFDLERA